MLIRPCAGSCISRNGEANRSSDAGHHADGHVATTTLMTAKEARRSLRGHDRAALNLQVRRNGSTSHSNSGETRIAQRLGLRDCSTTLRLKSSPNWMTRGTSGPSPRKSGPTTLGSYPRWCGTAADDPAWSNDRRAGNIGAVTPEAANATPARGRNVLVVTVLVAWLVAIAVGLSTRHFLFLVVATIGSAYLVSRLYLGHARRQRRRAP